MIDRLTTVFKCLEDHEVKYLVIGGIAAVLLCAGCRAPLPEPDFSPPFPHLRVLTYNVNAGFLRPSNALNHIERADPDIVCLQETTPQWREALMKRFAIRYPFAEFQEWGGCGGTAILSKFELTDIRVLPPKTGWFPAQLATARTPIGDVRILNVHLHPPLSERGKPSLSALYSTKQIRRSEIAGFVRRIESDGPLIMTGDFNESRDGKAMRWLVENGFSDALSIYDRSSRTWHWRWGLVSLSRRYDHIVFSDHLQCAGARVTEVESSDHMPVEAVLALRRPAAP